MTIALVDVYEGTGIRAGALEFLYRLMEERSTEPELNISHRAMPTFEQHRAFWTRRPYRFAYLIEAVDFQPTHQGMPGGPHHPWIGYVSATPRNEIGIVLLKEWRGHGFGPHAVRALVAKHRPNPPIPSEVNGHWLANINPANARSIGMFTALGFREIQRTYELNEEEDHGKEGPSKTG